MAGRLPTIDFMGKRWWTLAFSGTLLALAVIGLAVRGLNFGIDFTGGVLVEVGFPEPVALPEVRASLEGAGFDDAIVQYFGGQRQVLIRLRPGPTGAADDEELSTRVLRALEADHSGVEMRRVEFVGPQVGEELTAQGSLAVLYALIGILIYVGLRFEYRFAVGSVLALIHDVALTLGFFAWTQMSFDLSVLAAILAVIGYSLNDTIVIFDRVRETFRTRRRAGTEEVINEAVNASLPRTLVTSLTTLLVLIVLLVFGGEVILGFSAALTVGVIIGTYSSIYVGGVAALMLGISRQDMLPPAKEEGEGTS